MEKSLSRRHIIWSINLKWNSGKKSVNIKNFLSWSWIRNCKTWVVSKLFGTIIPCVRKRAWSYLVVCQGFVWFNRYRGGLNWFCWKFSACGAATVNSFVVLKTLEFYPNDTYQPYNQIKLLSGFQYWESYITSVVTSCFSTEGWNPWFSSVIWFINHNYR